jgi:hypothetical protein
MSDDKVGRGQARMGGWLGDYEDLVSHDDDVPRHGEPPLQVRKLWNPVTYRCAFCGESFVSKTMIRRHLERHAAQNAERAEAEGRAA